MNNSRGFILLTGIVYGAIFFAVFSALTSFVLVENKVQRAQSIQSSSLQVAEAGLEYYRWFLSHYPNDLQHGTGQSGPYPIVFNDPEAGVVGTSTLSIVGNMNCGVVTSIDITSVGNASASPQYARTLFARYARPTVGRFSYVLNESVWAGSDRVILGPYHSNGGVRMDGTANSEVSSSLASWNCTSSYGCSPASSSANGVLGNGPNSAFWKYPEPQVDFAGIAADFGALKTYASTSGRYFATNGSATANRGYRVTFNATGTVTVRPVNNTSNIQSLPVENYSSGDLQQDYTVPSTLGSATTYSIASSCGLLYFQDDVWVSGTTTRKIALVAADTQNSGVAPDITLVGDLKYSVNDGTTGLLAIAEGDIHIAANSPQNMTLNGIFIAQTGAFGRNLYKTNTSGSSCNNSYENRNTLTILGTTVSNKRTGTKWAGACGSYGGYNTRIDSYDRRVTADPPPFTPTISNDYYFIDWREL
jgi:hypothetical protein